MNNKNTLNRRHFLTGSSALVGASMLSGLPTIANSALGSSKNNAVINSDRPDHKVPILTGNEFDLYISKKPIIVNGKSSIATLINDSLPAPTLKMQEGDTVIIRVHNQMNEPTSIHWHGLLVPFEMDGVPGISFDGIPANSTFTYKFKLKQSGTYWYHSQLVHPAQKVSFDVTGEAGRWAWHCHLLYHMEAGMFREVAVV